jgi:hypothetical protein
MSFNLDVATRLIFQEVRTWCILSKFDQWKGQAFGPIKHFLVEGQIECGFNLHTKLYNSIIGTCLHY